MAGGCAARGSGGSPGHPAPVVAWPEGVERPTPALPTAGAPATLDGASLAVRSTGAPRDGAWVLDDNGYVGTYLRLDAPAAVTIAVRASRSGGMCPPFMAVGVGDARVGFEIGPDRDYPETFHLPAGTHFVRIDFHKGSCGGELVVGALSVWGATLVNSASDDNALAAADTYINSFRRGHARLRIDGAAPGTSVHVHLKRHAFHFGVSIPGTSNRFLVEGAPAQSDAARFQRFVLAHFNTVVPSNAGKWLYTEAVRTFVTMDYVDLILRWAGRHGLYTRMHVLLADTPQQPSWVLDLLSAAQDGDVGAKEELTRAIARRIRYSVHDRGEMYQELDVLDQPLHHPRYLEVLGAAEVRDVFNQVARSARDVGGAVHGYVNEYNVLQGSRVLAPEGGGREGAEDPFANWYRRYIEALREAPADLAGVGVAYNADARAGIASPHSPDRIFRVLQNLTAAGLPLTLTEFGVQRGASPAEAARALEDTMRLVFGTAGSNGFVLFGFWPGASSDYFGESVLVDKNWQPTEAGKRYETLMSAWTTDVTSVVGPDGTVDLTGFYGDYVVEVGGKALSFWLVKGQTEYAVSLH
jgi:GH35 family endo-1,4-beta-xylanase